MCAFADRFGIRNVVFASSIAPYGAAEELQISTNICGKKLKESGNKFRWTFEEAIEDWLKDNMSQGLN